MIKIQCAHISKSYLKFWHVPELGHVCIEVSIPHPPKHSPPYFLSGLLQIAQAVFRQFPIYTYIYIYIYIYISTFLELKVSCRSIDNLQPTKSNVKLLQCYGTFLTSRNLTCTRIKNTPQSRNDSAHQRTLQKPSIPQSVKWGRGLGIFSTYAKTQDCSILSIPAPVM